MVQHRNTFFGLTSLGAFEVSKNETLLHIFEEVDYKDAYDKVIKEKKKKKKLKIQSIHNSSSEDVLLSKDDIKCLLQELYHGPVPMTECELLNTYLESVVREKQESDKISWDDLHKAHLLIKKWKEEEEGEEEKGTNHTDIKQSEDNKEGDIKNKIENKVSLILNDTAKEEQHSSYREYRDQTNRHVRTKKGPNEILTKPLTNSQEYGWVGGCSGNDNNSRNNVEVMNNIIGPRVIKGKKSCAETIYANELVKSGLG